MAWRRGQGLRHRDPAPPPRRAGRSRSNVPIGIKVRDAGNLRVVGFPATKGFEQFRDRQLALAKDHEVRTGLQILKGVGARFRTS